ncbi:hypothetical protein H0H81_011763 [Sphagnurus paluster]|uniref:Cytochrome P450 n=1 Tax=Sphagnurus paluster TaxID=117069 RepID=A0A9P7KFQ5_9AGAR|nr:hypothetical protein H0H81_011763 [Sphagnurus paluster]
MFTDVAKKLEAVIKNKVAKGPQEIDILHWMSRAALEMIGQSGLGHSFDPLIEGVPENPYCDAVKSFVPVLAPILFLRETMLPTLVKYTSPGFRRLLVDTVPWARIRRLRDIVDVMDETSVRIFEDKKEKLRMGDEELANQVSRAKDIMSILMKANMEAAEEDRLPEKEVLGQMSTFTFAGTDTTSNAISRTLHLLSNNLEIQERLRAEVTAARKEHGEEVPFDELMALPLLDAVCRETLRLVRQDVVLPLSEPIKGLDGREMHEIFIPKDTTVFVSILNANRDPALWGPDSDVWNPDRWNAPLPKEISEARMPGIYSNMMTFLGGGRACIGFKFAQVEMKVMLAVLLSQFRFTPSLDKEIVWNMNGIVTPSVKNSKSLIESELPLNIEFVGNSA